MSRYSVSVPLLLLLGFSPLVLSPPDNRYSHSILTLDLLKYNEHEDCVKQVINQYRKVRFVCTIIIKNPNIMFLD